jgi:cellulose synthase/poly-beta-1,6-N-acetylglucosamine synthase-like glycosyltransferase
VPSFSGQTTCKRGIDQEIVITFLEWIFWLSVACVLYTYLGYPVALALAAQLRRARPIDRHTAPAAPVSVVLAARNEELRISARIRELVHLVAAQPHGGELIVVSDGSTDRTALEAHAAASEAVAATERKVAVRVLVNEPNLGKAMALNQAYAEAKHPLLVFADVRQTWADDAIDLLVAPFADPSIGAVSGDLVVESAPGVLAGVGVYWRFEKWLRRTESRFDSMLSVSGCISAARRELFPTLPAGTILDDLYWPMAVAMNGHRVVHEERARAFDRLPDQVRDEFRRKVRTLAGNFQFMARMPTVLLPWRNRLWWQFVSHRAMRLAVPWALLALAITAVATPGLVYRLAFWIQVIFYLTGLVGWLPAVAARSRLVSGIATFLVLNAAAWIAFWVWISGRAARCWSKISYDPPASSLRQDWAATR